MKATSAAAARNNRPAAATSNLGTDYSHYHYCKNIFQHTSGEHHEQLLIVHGRCAVWYTVLDFRHIQMKRCHEMCACL